MSQPVPVTRSRRLFSVRAVAVCAMLSAVAFVLMLMDFPLPFLIPDFVKMDVSELPSLLAWWCVWSRTCSTCS